MRRTIAETLYAVRDGRIAGMMTPVLLDHSNGQFFTGCRVR